eukprot:jgi/Ulvmu1/9032/UM005_0124.1
MFFPRPPFTEQGGLATHNTPPHTHPVNCSAHRFSSSLASTCRCGACRTFAAMINTDGTVVDLYIPRKCSWTNKLITAKDHASIQMNIGHLDESGVYSGEQTTFALRGNVRANGEADSSLDIMWKKAKDDSGQK